MNKTFKFVGLPAGDLECFCFAMSLADALRNGFYDLSHNHFFPDLVSVHPEHMMQELDAGQVYEFEITIKATPKVI